MAKSRARKAVVIGDGGWGTSLAILLVKNEIPTTLWSHDPAYCESMRRSGENSAFLPGIALPSRLAFTADPEEAVDGVDLVVSAVPMKFLRDVCSRFENLIPRAAAIVSATKGFEVETLRRPSEILKSIFADPAICVLSGPSHAEEVARAKVASVVAASEDASWAAFVQRSFNSDSFRVYTNTDPVGTEIAAALKNVVAIAAGICDGLELGDNAKSALLTRGVVEIARFGTARGAKLETFFGLAGIGDLATTCFSPHSRNRSVGEAIGRGENLEEILGRMQMVAEGVGTVRALFEQREQASAAGGPGVAMPIAEQVHAVLFEGKDPAEAVRDLMRRDPVEEMHGF